MSATAIGGAAFLGQPLQLGAVIGLVLAFMGVRLVSSPVEGRTARRVRQRLGRLVFGQAG